MKYVKGYFLQTFLVTQELLLSSSSSDSSFQRKRLILQLNKNTGFYISDKF